MLTAKLEDEAGMADLTAAVYIDGLLGSVAKHRLKIASKTKEQLEKLTKTPLTILAHKSSELTQKMLVEGVTVWGQHQELLTLLTLLEFKAQQSSKSLKTNRR